MFEPFGVLSDPGVVRGGLEGQVDGHVDARARASVTRARKSASVPSSGWIAVWPPAALPMAQGLPGSSAPAAEGTRSVPFLAVVPIGWIGGR